MKLTIENLRAIIKEELEDVQQPCAKLHPKIKSLLIKEDFELFIQAIELYITINQLNAGIVYTEEKFKDKRDEQLGNKQFFFILEGSYEDVRKVVMCLKLDKLRSGVQDFSLDNFHFYAFVKYIGDGHTYNFLESHGYKPPDEELEDGE